MPNRYVLNYVILITHFSHLYSMWDFNHTCNPTISPSRVSLCLSVASRPLYGLWTSPIHSPLPNKLFTSSAHHPWVSRTPSKGTTCQPRTHIHGNPVRPCPWIPRTTPLFSTISNIPLLGFFLFSSPGFLCVGRLGFLCPRWVRTMNTSLPSPHITWLWYHL